MEIAEAVGPLAREAVQKAVSASQGLAPEAL
jgi:hypothetical protein